MWNGDWTVEVLIKKNRETKRREKVRFMVTLDDGWEFNDEGNVLTQNDPQLTEVKVYRDEYLLQDKEIKAIFRSYPELRQKLLKEAQSQCAVVQAIIDMEE